MVFARTIVRSFSHSPTLSAHASKSRTSLSRTFSGTPPRGKDADTHAPTTYDACVSSIPHAYGQLNTTYRARSLTVRRTVGESAAVIASESTLRKRESVSGVWRALSNRALTCAPSNDVLWCFFAISSGSFQRSHVPGGTRCVTIPARGWRRRPALARLRRYLSASISSVSERFVCESPSTENE